MSKKVKIGIVSSVILFVGLTISFKSAIGGERKLLKKLNESNFAIKYVFVPFKGKDIRVVQTGNPEGDDLLFIHGSPGDWIVWKDIVIDTLLQENFNIILVDRPGYGKTTAKAEATLVEQAKAIKSVVDFFNLDSIIMVSHSYGGAVAEQVMLDYSNKIKHNIFISPTLSPELQHPKWYNKVGRRMKFLLPKMFKSSNIEMWGLGSCLLENESKIAFIKTPITFFHGEKDWLVPVETVDYYKKYASSKVKYIIEPEESHFILWSSPDLIVEEILIVY